MTTAYREGYYYAEAGRTNNNPYSPITQEYKDWEEGYYDFFK